MRDVRLAEVLIPDADPYPLDANVVYETVGILSYGRGLFRRPPVRGEVVSYERYFRLRAGMFVYSRLFAWEGALAVVGDTLDGWFVSPEFPTFRIDERLAVPAYVSLLCQWPWFWEQIRSQETGMGGRRKRVYPDALLGVVVPLLPIAEQRRVVDLIAAVDAQMVAAGRAEQDSWTAIATVRETSLDWADLVPLGSLCTIQSSLVDPTVGAYADLPHIGIERIESRTGRLLATNTAAEDGVTSGKFVVDPADVVYSKIRPELRKAAYPAIRALCSADAYPLRPSPGVDPDYLLEVLLSDRFSEVAIGRSGRTKMPKINRRELLTIEVPTMPVGRQIQIGRTTRALRALGAAARAERDAAERLREALLQDLLSGDHQIPSSYDRFLDGAA